MRLHQRLGETEGDIVNSVTWHGASRHLARRPQWIVHHPFATLLRKPVGWPRGVLGFQYGGFSEA